MASAAKLQASGFTVHRLELEITESVLLQKSTGTLDTLHGSRRWGLRDDFGTGYSSPSYLRMFPFDKIKIDKSFVQEMPNRADCAAIVSAVTASGAACRSTPPRKASKRLSNSTLLQAAGCTQAQGYLFSRPQSGSELNFGDLAPAGHKGAAA